jgi:hypothetical protein
MINNMIIASVNAYTQGTNDKNGKSPVILNVVSGTFPNRNVISGTVAENLGIETGHTYLFQVREVEANEYGRQFIYSKLKELEALEIVTAAAQMGAAVLVDIDKTAETKTKEALSQAKSEFA